MSEQLEQIKAYLEAEYKAVQKVDESLIQKAMEEEGSPVALQTLTAAAVHRREVLKPLSQLVEASKRERGALEHVIIELAKIGEPSYVKAIASIINTFEQQEGLHPQEEEDEVDPYDNPLEYPDESVIEEHSFDPFDGSGNDASR